MTVYLALNHLLNFIAPAVFLAACFTLHSVWVTRKARSVGRRSGLGLRHVFGWHVLAGTMVLLLGLLVTGRDGRMMTYLALVGVAAFLQMQLHRRF